MTAELIFIGTELLLGDIVNTNAVYISKLLALNGVDVLNQSVVGDNEKRLSESIKLALSRSDIIITTGGLGPTKDDITKETVAKLLDLPLETDEKTLQKIKSFFSVRNVEMSKTNEKQALIPRGAEIIENSNGTAPGCIIKKDNKLIIILPGPPREMKPMIDFAVMEHIAPKTERILVSHQIRFFGIGESLMAERAGDLLDSENPTVAPYAKEGEAFLRITAAGKTNDECEELMKPLIDEIQKRLGEYIYGIDVGSIEEATVELLKRNKLKVASAESLTGGLIAKRITDISGSSEIFECGVVSYSDNVKNNLLGVKKETLEEFKAVSSQTAKEMAEGIRKLSGADIGVSSTGIAGPNSDSSGKEAGTFFIGVSTESGTRVIEVRTGQKGSGCREFNRTVAASNALNEVRKTAIEIANQ